MADAAYDADHLRRFIIHDLVAEPRIKQNPTRSTTQPIDWMLYRERHFVECFFNKIQRFRRIALRGRSLSQPSDPLSHSLAQWFASLKCRRCLKHPGNRQLYDKRGGPDAGARLSRHYPRFQNGNILRCHLAHFSFAVAMQKLNLSPASACV